MAAEKPYTIVVNGREATVDGPKITFEAVTSLAFPSGGSNQTFTVTYRRGQGSKPPGSLRAGESVNLKEGMVFNVTATTKS